jgi:diadenosine tetraphosphate (Ap4A) HIT family hydrolase
MSPDLQAIRERLPELDAWWEPPVSQAKDDLESLLAEVERLRAALRPFVGQAEIIGQNDAADRTDTPDHLHFRLAGSYAAITVGDCRRAAEALFNPPSPSA